MLLKLFLILIIALAYKINEIQSTPRLGKGLEATDRGKASARGNCASGSDGTTPKVCSSAGCVMGKLMPGYQIDYFEAFLGIPYAMAPVGDLRFANPKAYPRWHDVLNATEPQSDCIQKNYLLPDPQITGSEDCLYLNIYRPKSRKSAWKLLPVMVYIHGGGWFAGSAHPGITGPEYIMDSEKVILITFTYRLGAFGFLSTGDANMPGNFGLKDQIMLLKWIQNNIQSYGGNPKSVTAFGQSAGAISAHMHMLSKQAVGLIHAVIALSGTANVPFAINDEPLEQARLVALHSNVSNANDLSTVKLVKALRNVSSVEIMNAGDKLKFWDVDHLTNYRPVVESQHNSHGNDAYFTEHPTDIIAKGNYKAVPLLSGFVPKEGAVRVVAILENEHLRKEFNENFDYLLETLLEFPKHFNSTQLQARMALIMEEYFNGQHQLNDETGNGFLDLITDRGFHYPFFKHMEMFLASNKNQLYLYQFNYKGPHTFADIYTGGPTKRDYGVVHCDDLIYFLRSNFIFPDFEKNSKDAKAIKDFVDYLVHFAIYRKPHVNNTRQCTKQLFSELVKDSSAICDYQHFQNVPETGALTVATDNKFNVKRMHLWDKILSNDDVA